MEIARELLKRGLIESASSDAEIILSKKRIIYIGVDPTADSMHVGHLVWLLLMKRLGQAGHELIFLVGGGTGMIGDPKDKTERPLLEAKQVQRNVRSLKKQLQMVLGKTKFRIVNNGDWLLQLDLNNFLRNVGKHFTVNELIKRDVIRNRLSDSDDSISFTEFSYTLLQGYDYLTLNKNFGCDLQIGGSDQWTNLLSGVGLIRKELGREVHAITFPLVTDSNGRKFGKSEGNAVWLDSNKTSPENFYNFWLNQPNDSIEKYLKLYSFKSLKDIDQIVREHNLKIDSQVAQKSLAKEITALVHGVTF